MSKAKYKYSDEILKEILSEVTDQFDSLNIKHYVINSIRFGNLRSSNAECVQTVDYAGNVKEEIVICKAFARNESDCTRKDLKDLIMHELIHSVISNDVLTYNKTDGKAIYRNLPHGERWNEIAKEIEKRFPEYSLFSPKSYDDIVYPQFPVKYIYSCPRCGSNENIRATEVEDRSFCFFCGNPIKLKKPDII